MHGHGCESRHGVEMSSFEDLEPIFVDSNALAVRISSRLMSDMCAHALESQPEECCGVVVGSERNRFSEVYRCRNVMSLKHRDQPRQFPRDGTQAYYMNEADYLRAQQEAQERGESITAVYHSHVGAGLHFSVLDQLYAKQALFPFPGAAQIVISVWDRVLETGIFESDDEASGFRGFRLDVAKP